MRHFLLRNPLICLPVPDSKFRHFTSLLSHTDMQGSFWESQTQVVFVSLCCVSALLILVNSDLRLDHRSHTI
jgi:hypothetical protein